jgi:MFS family permease
VLSIGGGARFAVGLTLKLIVDDFGWGRSELGLAVALLQVVSAATMFGAGHLADRMGPRLVLGGGLLVGGDNCALARACAVLGNGAACIAPFRSVPASLMPLPCRA